MNAKSVLLAAVVLVTGVFAQSDQKFQLYGFADMAITKYFPNDASTVRNVSLMDERLMFSFDHLNLYQEYRPNNRVRFLTEMSYQDKPPTSVNKNGMEIIMKTPFGNSDSVWTAPMLADTNKVMKGIVNYEWGSFSVERAQMSVNVNRYLNFTFGKFITPAGIWNVDHGSPVIMTVNQPSQYTFREIYPKSQLGIMENGTYFIGDADLTYTAYLSSGRGNPIINKVGELAAGGQARVGLPVLDECTIGISGYTGTQTAVLRTQLYTMTTQDFVTFETETSISDKRLFRYRENVFGGDFRIKKSIFALQGEYNYQFVNNTMRKDWDKDSMNTTIMATYLLGSVDAYRNNDVKLTPYAFYEYVRYMDTYNNPNLFLNTHGIIAEGTPEATSTDMALGYMKFMAGVNMRFFTNFGIKAEYNFTRLYMSKKDYAHPDGKSNEIADDKDGLWDIPGVTAQFYIAF